MPVPLRPALPLLAIAIAVLAWSCGGQPPAAAEPAPGGRPSPSARLPAPLLDLPAPAAAGELRTAVLAGGCFWCEEAVFEQLAGVAAVVSGYAGGTAETATYELYDRTGHAEAVKITYDPARISYGQLLRVLFTAGDPTTKDGQHPDYGHQYRMAVFYADADQQRVAEAYLRQLADAKIYPKPLAVTVEPMPLGFFPAEEYHQHYVTRHPTHPYVQRWSLPKIALVRATFPESVKPADQTPPNR